LLADQETIPPFAVASFRTDGACLSAPFTVSPIENHADSLRLGKRLFHTRAERRFRAGKDDEKKNFLSGLGVPLASRYGHNAPRVSGGSKSEPPFRLVGRHRTSLSI
jgi:hypothetical protein